MSAVGTAAPPPERTFSATELEAAANLVLLSESSSFGEGEVYLHEAGRGSCCSSSSLPSVNTKAISVDPKLVEEEDDSEQQQEEAIDEETTGPWARRRRYRSIAVLYMMTERVDGNKRRKKNS